VKLTKLGLEPLFAEVEVVEEGAAVVEATDAAEFEPHAANPRDAVARRASEAR